MLIMGKKKEVSTDCQVAVVGEIQEESWTPFTEVNPEIGVPIRVKFGNGNIFDGAAYMTSLGYMVDCPAEPEDYKSGLVGWMPR